MKTREALLKELADLQEQLKYKEGLPHIFAQKFYPWARRVWDSTNKDIYLCSANQVGKSSIAIRKNIRLATDPTLWPKFWPNLLQGQKPNLLWYMLPTAAVAQTEFETKWDAYWLPRNEFKTHPIFGWEPEFEKGMISKIRFNSGVTIQFKFFSQKARDLQTATVYHVTADEELPVELFPEVKARLNATDGYYLAVFTATLGQTYLQQTMEPSTPSEERAKDALKLQVSLFDSMVFDDGSPSHWTKAKINRAIANCPTEAEIQRRVYGRFVRATGLMYEGFAIGKNMVPQSAGIPKGWSVWSGVDVGSGGQSGHPAAIVFIAVSSDFKQGRVFRAWRGDGIPTTATDIVDKYRELKKDLTVTYQAYDFASADFFTVASRLGESFNPANKKREAGIGLLNSLFKCRMLSIERDDPELEKLVQELTTLSTTDNKRKTVDDLCFAGETKIFTNRGSIPISEVKIGDYALTRQGFKPVSAITESIAHVINVEHTSGGVTWVTANHSYITNQRLKQAQNLTLADCCLGLSKSTQQKFTSLRESNLDVIQTKNAGTFNATLFAAASIESVAFHFCIEKFTSIVTAKFQRILWFIILMAIRLTTVRKTLNYCLNLNTSRGICLSPSESKNHKMQSSSRNWPLPHGTKRRKEMTFTDAWGTCLGLIASMSKKIARFAIAPIKSLFKSRKRQIFAQINVEPKTVGLQALITNKKIVWYATSPSAQVNFPEQKPALRRVHLKAGQKSKIAQVFNLTVEDAHEYFADGVLVANCDALRYAAMSVPWNFEGLDESMSIEHALAEDRKPIPQKSEADLRRDWSLGRDKQNHDESELEDEFDFWNEFSGA